LTKFQVSYGSLQITEKGTMIDIIFFWQKKNPLPTFLDGKNKNSGATDMKWVAK